MDLPITAPTPPKGLAFEIPDLMLLQGWAEFHNVQMIVELHRDMAIDDEAMSVVLDLLDKLYALRRQMRDLLSAVDELPEAHRDKLLSRIGRLPGGPES